ncbi:MAG: hypothetical protein J6S69_01195, partial [Proteobacteria bacterium]|nr:hypothetical protein [Pseudomonadota bacterium]
MRVRFGGYCNSGKPQYQHETCFGVDPSGSIMVMAAGLGESASISSSCVCADIVKSLVPHRSQMETMAADARPDSRRMLLSSL